MAEAQRIDGKAVAAQLRARVAAVAAEWKAARGIVPGLAVVLVGADPASEVYVRSKIAATREAGLVSIERRLPENASEAEILATVHALDADPAVDGILVQLPLPAHVGADRVTDAIDPAKDVDGFHVVNAGRLWTTGGGLVPCTPTGCMILLRQALPDLAGRHAVVIGRSAIVGKPIAGLLLGADCTVTIAHSRTRDLPALCRTADILVAAVGRPQMVRGDWIKPGAVVIDVGVNRTTTPEGKTRLVGDVAYAEAMSVASAITPVPGGVGPMTVACLLRSTLIAAARRRGLAAPDL